MIDGVGSPPFSAETIPPIERPAITYKNDVLERSREQFARKRSEIESTVVARQQEFAMAPPKKKEGDNNKRRPNGPGQGFGGHNGPRPQMPLQQMPQAQQAPRPQQPPRAETPASNSPRPTQTDADRNVLRAAILAARPSELGLPVRSPIEILREKQAQKTTRDASNAPKPIAKPAPNPGPNPGPNPAPSHKEAPEVSSSNDEGVSPELLRSVINGDGPLT
jgi:hypothetical protein